MVSKRGILVRVVIGVAILVGGVYAAVRLDIWQAERRAQQDLEPPIVPESDPPDPAPTTEEPAQ